MSDDVLRVGRSIRIPRSELSYRFTASGGPGGQHANKAATRVEITFDIAGSPSIGEDRRARLVERLGPSLRVVADGERSQVRNRLEAEERLVRKLSDALVVQRSRRPTKPTRGSQRRRLDAKRRRSDTKAARRRPRHDD